MIPEAFNQSDAVNRLVETVLSIPFAVALTIVYASVLLYLKSRRPQRQHSIPACNQDYQGNGTILETTSLLGLVVFSHCICYYLWWAAEFNQGCLGNPFPLPIEVIQRATPNTTSIIMYAVVIVYTLLCAVALPGVTVSGYPVKIFTDHDDDTSACTSSSITERLPYNCNGLASWYLSIVLAVILHTTGVFDWKQVYSHSGALLSTAIFFADAIAVLMYLECLRTHRCIFSIQTFAHDFVMGGYLNPRLGPLLDLKLWAEVRVSWMLLYALDVSAALCLREELGYIPYRMWLVLLIHGLYTNACMKGEESIPFTWDIFHERWGWMLIFWNLAGVAFAYTFNGRFLASQGADLEDFSFPVFCIMAIAVLAAYWVFDEANAQKNRFRAKLMDDGYVERRFSFPQLPNATLKNPRYLDTKVGTKLLVDGWWLHVRKPHYTADLCLALLLSLTGFGEGHFLPFFFVFFFGPMLVHRAHRDMVRCSEKYGADWDRYKAMVPYTFVPGAV
jgi:delta24(24(1))-sterol reductase